MICIQECAGIFEVNTHHFNLRKHLLLLYILYLDVLLDAMKILENTNILT